MGDTVTLRPHLHGSLTDIVESVPLGEISKCSIICELVSLFVDYKEEGNSLFLDAFVTDDLQKLTGIIPDGAVLKLGEADCSENGVRKAVKKSAPLVRGCWKLYLAPVGDQIEFGLFRDSGHPLNVPIDVLLQCDGFGMRPLFRAISMVRISLMIQQ
jgi:hypothetical protein